MRMGILMGFTIFAGLFMLALGGVDLGFAYKTADIEERSRKTRLGSFKAAFGVAIFGLGFGGAMGYAIYLLQRIAQAHGIL